MSRGIKREVIKARRRVRAEIQRTASRGGLYAGGLSGEGYAGGYAQALSDILLALEGVRPSTRGYWDDWKERES